MELQKYFNGKDGVGILSTSDDNGRVNSAIYSKPYFISENEVVFVMANRRTRNNVQVNPYASYTFLEKGSQSCGKRLHLRKIKEIIDKKKVSKFRNENSKNLEFIVEDDKSSLVHFLIEEQGPLLGNGTYALDGYYDPIEVKC
jgi:D-lyxose ketol-isomerase